MKAFVVTFSVVLLLAGCQTPEPPQYPVDTVFMIRTAPSGAHIILASPSNLYPLKYLGTTPIDEPWGTIVSDLADVPEDFYVLAIKDGYLPADDHIKFQNLEPTKIHLSLTKGAPTVLTRNAFRSFCRGLSIEDVKTIWGTPVSSTSTQDGMELFYSGITYDPVAEVIDNMIQIIVRNGKVREVNYY